MPNHLTPDEQARLEQIEAGLTALAEQAAPLKTEKAAILARGRQRAHYQRNKSSSQS